MKVELWYDPVHTETGVCLNGYWQGSRDIYSFLYAVRHYPLQAWLEPDGSWTGLRQQVLDISRGEEVELAFHGRETDFADVSGIFRETDPVLLRCCPWDSGEAYAGLRGQVETIVKAAGAGAPAGLSVEEALGMAEGERAQPGWYFAAGTEEELRQAEQVEEPCVLVDEALLDSYDQLSRMGKLTRSLRRPAQAVCCRIRDGERRREFARYAAQFPRYGFTFMGADEEAPPAFLFEKYGRPYLTRMEQERYREIGERMDALLAGFSGEDKAMRVQELVYRQQQGALTQEDRRELAMMQDQKSWVARNEGAGAKIRALAEFRAIRQREQGEEYE